jgi:ABC-type nitrate/sulfonate/bicarbonate transport system permease component
VGAAEAGELMAVETDADVDAPAAAGVGQRSTSSLVRTSLARAAGNVGWILLSLVVTMVLWVAFLHVYHVPKVIGRSPIDVYHYLFTQKPSAVHKLRSAAGNRSVLWHNLKTTLRDAAIGYVAGFVAAMVVACIFVLWRPLEQTFMPIALVLRSVPLFAMIPLITLIFGRDIMAVAVIAGIVCFFPALVNIMFGLRSTSRSSHDLMAVYGASRFSTLRKVQIPSAVPSIFAALRINVPAAIIGALLAEWLATGKGSGNEMLEVINTFDYGELWSAVVLVTLASIIAYSVVSTVEAAVVPRFAPDTVGKKT